MEMVKIWAHIWDELFYEKKIYEKNHKNKTNSESDTLCPNKNPVMSDKFICKCPIKG